MSRRLLAIALLLSVSYAVSLWMTSDVSAPSAPRLERLPKQFGDWTMIRETGLPPETLSVLHADATLVREYELTPGCRVHLFIAYYRTQHAGESMHSPRNCLPGSGWETVSSSSILANLGDRRHDLINRYLVEKDGKQILVEYWYQEHNRVISNEYSGKLYLIWDSIRREHRDGALVRVDVPLRNGLSEEQANAQASQFLRLAAPEIKSTLFQLTGRD